MSSTAELNRCVNLSMYVCIVYSRFKELDATHNVSTTTPSTFLTIPFLMQRSQASYIYTAVPMKNHIEDF